MENKINLQELMLRQIDLSLTMKSSVETKAVGYLTVVSLILGILIDFVIETYQIVMHPVFKFIMLGFYCSSFIAGIIVLCCCSIILYPRNIAHLDADDLLNLHNLMKSKECDADEFLIEEAEEILQINNETVRRLDILNRKASNGMIAVVTLFVFSCISFFIFVWSVK